MVCIIIALRRQSADAQLVLGGFVNIIYSVLFWRATSPIINLPFGCERSAALLDHHCCRVWFNYRFLHQNKNRTENWIRNEMVCVRSVSFFFDGFCSFESITKTDTIELKWGMQYAMKCSWCGPSIRERHRVFEMKQCWLLMPSINRIWYMWNRAQTI